MKKLSKEAEARANRANVEEADEPLERVPNSEAQITSFLEANGWSDGGGGNNFTYYSREGREIYVFAFSDDRGPNDSHFIEIDESGEPIGAGFFFQDGEEGITTSAKKRLG